MKRPLYWTLAILLLLVWGVSIITDGVSSFIRCVSSTLLGASITLELIEESDS